MVKEDNFKKTSGTKAGIFICSPKAGVIHPSLRMNR